MIHARLEAINEEILLELCEEKVPETISLDFKRQLYGSTQDDKAEFMKDVCAFANSEGGDLVFGIAEANGGAGRIMPLVEPVDRAMRRLGQMLDGSVEPRISGLRWQAVDVSGGYVLVLRVPRSLSGPHRAVVNQNSRFPIRNGTHIADMSYDQIRDAFGRTATLLERARAFRHERLEAIVGMQTKRLNDGSRLAIHLIPMESMSGRAAIDLIDLASRFHELQGYRWNGASRTYNLDGLLVWEETGTTATPHFTQAFRSGALETVDAKFSYNDGSRRIASAELACTVRECVLKLTAVATGNGFEGSAVLGLFLGTGIGIELYMGQVFNMHGTYKADREHLIFPEIWIESLQTADLESLVKQLLDTVWQAFGLEACSYYDDRGQWALSRRFS